MASFIFRKDSEISTDEQSLTFSFASPLQLNLMITSSKNPILSKEINDQVKTIFGKLITITRNKNHTKPSLQFISFNQEN